MHVEAIIDVVVVFCFCLIVFVHGLLYYGLLYYSWKNAKRSEDFR